MPKHRRLKGELHITQSGAIFRPDAQPGGKCPDEIFVPEHLMQNVIDGDTVSVGFNNSQAYTEFDMTDIKVLSRDREVLGVFVRAGHVEPLHEVGISEIRAHNKTKSSLASGDIVLLKLHTPKDKARGKAKDEKVVGDIVQVFDNQTDAELERQIVLREFGVPAFWPETALQRAEQVARQKISECMSGREDLRELDFVTIDGQGARDFDDAIFCKAVGKEWQISVAIADVSFYVKAGDKLDREAFKRGTSVYLPGLVVPMLPKALSDDACSLRPKEDKLVLVCRFTLSANGKINRYEFVRAVIRSRARLYYDEVGEFLSGEKSLAACPQAIAEMLKQAERAYRVLLAARQQRKALDFDTIESKILFNADGTIRKIAQVVRNDAHRLIEEFMLAANVCATRFIVGHGQAMLFRIHKGLKSDSISDLRNFAASLGLSLTGTKAADLADLFESAKRQSSERAIQTMILRSLSCALYQPENLGHFGLALDSYGHFTSPIRRYPDLIVHRIIHRLLDSPTGEFYPEKQLVDIGKHCSMAEKRADDATYSFEKYLKCVYACGCIGKEFTGTVIEVTNFGLFVELEDLWVEGLLHIRHLGPDYYIFDGATRCLLGETTGQKYGLLDAVSVVLTASDPETRRIDLRLSGASSYGKRGRRR